MAYTPVDWTKQTEKSDSGHTIPSAVKHKGEVYHYTGRHGINHKSGQASHEYRSSDEKTDKRVWRTIDGKVMEESMDEALSTRYARNTSKKTMDDFHAQMKAMGAVRKSPEELRAQRAKEAEAREKAKAREAKKETEVTEDTFSQGRKEWGARMDKIIAAKKRKEEKEREAKKAKIRDQIGQSNKEYYATRKAMKNESEGLEELYVKDSDKAFELKNKIDRLKKTHAKHVATLASTPDTVGNSEKRINLGMKIDGLKRNIKKHVDAHKKLAPAEYHESVEELDELKRSTLNSYIAKGRRDADLGGMYAASGRTPRTPYEKKLQNRYKGAIKASMKLSRGDYQKESIEESIKAGDHVTHQGKTYKVFRADGTTLHVGQRHGDNRYGGSKMLHTSKVEKITKLSPDEEAARKEKFMSTFEKTRKEKQARTMKKRGMPDTASKLSKEETSEKLSNAINSLRNL